MLGTLPPERQKDIAEYAQAHTLKDTIAWLAADGIRTNKSSLSEWLSSFSWEELYSEAESDAQKFMDLVRKSAPEIEDAKVEQFGNAFFQMRAIKRDQPELFLKFRTAKHRAQMDVAKLAQREKEMALELEKFKESTKSKLESGLDEIAQAFKGNPKAMELYQQARALIGRQLQG